MEDMHKNVQSSPVHTSKSLETTQMYSNRRQTATKHDTFYKKVKNNWNILLLGIYLNAMIKTLYKRERVKIRFTMTVPSHRDGESGEEDWRELHGNM